MVAGHGCAVLCSSVLSGLGWSGRRMRHSAEVASVRAATCLDHPVLSHEPRTTCGPIGLDLFICPCRARLSTLASWAARAPTATRWVAGERAGSSRRPAARAGERAGSGQRLAARAWHLGRAWHHHATVMRGRPASGARFSCRCHRPDLAHSHSSRPHSHQLILFYSLSLIITD